MVTAGMLMVVYIHIVSINEKEYKNNIEFSER